MLNEPNLLFIVSQPRSGSTLLQSIISNNNQIATVSEPWLLFHFLSYFNPHLIDAKYSYRLAHEATKDFLEKTSFQERIKEEIRNCVGKIYQKTLGHEEETKYILDKTPRYYEITDSIRDIFPTAKIIILKRNPLAVLSSIIDTWKVRGINGLYPYHRDIMEAPFLIQGFVERSKNDANVLVTSYEDFTANPEIESERIYQWLGLEFGKCNLDYSKNKKYKGKYGDPVGIQQDSHPVRKAENWLKKLNCDDWKDFFVGYIDYIDSSFLNSYGYSIDQVEGSSTKIFNTFRFISKQEIPSHPSIGNYLTYSYHRIAYKMYSR